MKVDPDTAFLAIIRSILASTDTSIAFLSQTPTVNYLSAILYPLVIALRVILA